MAALAGIRSRHAGGCVCLRQLRDSLGGPFHRLNFIPAAFFGSIVVAIATLQCHGPSHDMCVPPS